MNHAFSSPRNELERSAVARPLRQINNVICSLGSRPIHSGPKDFARMVRKDECRSSALSQTKTARERTSGEIPFPGLRDPLSLSLIAHSLFLFLLLLLVTVFHSLPLFSDNRTCQRQRCCLNKSEVTEARRTAAGFVLACG